MTFEVNGKQYVAIATVVDRRLGLRHGDARLLVVAQGPQMGGRRIG
jgi:hypothetical protein